MAWFNGERTVEEQLRGLDAVLDTISGKTVLDLGCAEGCISAVVKDRGATLVHGVESNPQLLAEAQKIAAPGLKFMRGNLNIGLPDDCLYQYNVILLLAILHKLGDPEVRLREYAARATDSVVIRLPLDSRGRFTTKHQGFLCDTDRVMTECGFNRTELVEGPRGELVAYWAR